ncbi:uncharacterized protein LOC132301657 [Cornus florida]|uniref:uncharacterized protein LOC132301657 n=1 Tax=Cornus florida TaxID=4283 RepID=UPI0028A198F6|nr:uncharacterized protein LOC132301657 [Cornus florida]
MGGASSSILVHGFSWLYGSSGGEIELQEIMNGLINTQMYNSPGISIALIFITVGIGFKLSLAPSHQWTPDVYEGVRVRNDESLYDKQIHFASSLLRVVPTKDRTNDVYNYPLQRIQFLQVVVVHAGGVDIAILLVVAAAVAGNLMETVVGGTLVADAAAIVDIGGTMVAAIAGTAQVFSQLYPSFPQLYISFLSNFGPFPRSLVTL